MSLIIHAAMNQIASNIRVFPSVILPVVCQCVLSVWVCACACTFK